MCCNDTVNIFSASWMASFQIISTNIPTSGSRSLFIEQRSSNIWSKEDKFYDVSEWNYFKNWITKQNTIMLKNKNQANYFFSYNFFFHNNSEMTKVYHFEFVWSHLIGDKFRILPRLHVHYTRCVRFVQLLKTDKDFISSVQVPDNRSLRGQNVLHQKEIFLFNQ